MKKENIWNYKIFYGFLILNIVPILFTILDIYLSYEFKFSTFILVYNYNNSFILSEIFKNTSKELVTIFILIYNYILTLLFFNIKVFFNKHILKICILIAILSSVVGGTFLGIMMSV